MGQDDGVETDDVLPTQRPGSVGHRGQEEAVRLGVAGVFEGGWISRGGQLGGRAGPHHARLELSLVQGGDTRGHGAGRVP